MTKTTPQLNPSSDLRRYGFEMRNGQTIQVEATGIREAIALAEKRVGTVVSRGCELGDGEGIDPHPSIGQDAVEAVANAWRNENRRGQR